MHICGFAPKVGAACFSTCSHYLTTGCHEPASSILQSTELSFISSYRKNLCKKREVSKMEKGEKNREIQNKITMKGWRENYERLYHTE